MIFLSLLLIIDFLHFIYFFLLIRLCKKYSIANKFLSFWIYFDRLVVDFLLLAIISYKLLPPKAQTILNENNIYLYVKSKRVRKLIFKSSALIYLKPYNFLVCLQFTFPSNFLLWRNLQIFYLKLAKVILTALLY